MFEAISAPLKLWRTKRQQINIKVRKALIVSLIAPLFVTVSAPPSIGLTSAPSDTAPTKSTGEIKSPFADPASLKISQTTTQSANLNLTGLVARFDAKTYASYTGTGTSWSDISGNGLSAAFTNKSSPLTSDYTSGGITFKGIGFNGTNQFATINSSLNANYSSGISISFFANFGSVANNYERIIDIGANAASENILVARESTSTNLIAEVFSGTGSIGWCRAINAIPATATWAHYAFVFNGTSCSLYKDGTLYTGGAIQRYIAGSAAATSNTGTVAYTGLPASGTVNRANAWIGRSNWGSDAYFEGAIADVAIFNRALTPTDAAEWRVDQMSSTIHTGSGGCANRVANPAAATVTAVGGDCVVRFTAPSNTTTSNTWIVPSGVTTAKVLTVGGGGGGGAHVGGGGGAGGFIESITSVTATSAISISVGAGGAGTSYPNAVHIAGAAGTNSVFGTSFTALGGGRGATWTNVDKTDGGSGGGSSSTGSWYPTGGLATNAAQGYAGGSSLSGCGSTYGYPTGGGGGAGGVGGSATCLTYSTGKAGDGGIGKISDVTGTPTYYAGGGGGGIHGQGTYLGIVGNGGLGGGGEGAGHGRVNTPGTYQGTNGTDGLGGGGGGSGAPGLNTYTSTGGRGGSGVVIVRYGTTTLAINSNGGSGFTGTTSFSGTTFSNITLPAQSGLTRSGFTFGGWNTAADGSGTNYSAGSVYQLNITTTLYAQWRSVISYDANGATSTRALETTSALGSGTSTSLSSGQMANGAVVTAGLQLHLDASNPTSYPGTGSTWFDLSGNGRNATAVNAPTFDPINKTFTLNGTNQYFEFPTTEFTYSGTNSYTLATMFKTSNLPKGEQCLICRFQNGVAGSYMMRLLAGVPQTHRESVGGFSASGYMAGSSEYDYLVTTFNGATVKIFLNGIEIYSGNNSGSASTSSTVKTSIGRSFDNSRYFEGNIYSAQIYNVALTQEQIIQNYNALLPRALVNKTSSTLTGWSSTSDSSTSAIVGSNGTLLAGLPTPYIRLEAKNYDGTTWTPTNYNGNGITYSEVKPTKNTNQTGWGATATFPTVSGLAANTVAIYLNNPELSSYTFCGMARYKTNGVSAPASMGRIFTGTSVDWLAGWYNSNTKDFYHSSGYLNNSTAVDYNWHYLCDSGNNIYWDGVKLTATNQTYTKLPTLAIGGAYANSNWSDFEITEVIVYDQFLTASQIAQINQYFKSTYGVTAGAIETATPTMVPPTNFASTGTSTLYARWGSTITYDGNGQSNGTPPAPQVFANGVGTLASNSGSLAKAGFNFVGWNTRADGTGTFYAPGASYSGPNSLLFAVYQAPVKIVNTLSASDPIALSPYMRFKASDYDATKKIWYDSSGNARNTSSVRGDPTVVTTTVGNGSTKAFQVVSGGTTAGIKFNNPEMANSSWTVFSVARYNGAQSGLSRIFDGEYGNFLFGFYNSASGVAHYGAWVTGSGNVHGTNWLVSTGYTDAYRSNGVLRGTGDASNILPPLTINAGQFVGSELSVWQVAETIIFDRKLSDTEIKKVEDYLSTTYGISGYSLQQSYSDTISVSASAGLVTFSDTFTASLGYRNTFSVSPSIPGITLENVASNQVRLRIASTVGTGTYWETITVTDTAGNSALLPIRIEVVAALQWSASNPASVSSTFGKYTRHKLDISGGFGTRVSAVAHASSPAPRGISIDTSTISSGSIYLVVDTGTAIGTYTESITVTDGSGLVKTTILTITINAPPDIGYSTSSDSVYPYVTQNLLINLDAANPNSYSGTGTTWTDTASNRSFTLSGSPTYSQSNGGILTFSSGKEATSNTNWSNLETFTVETWFNLRSLSTVYPCFVTTTYSSTHINFAICQSGAAGSLRAGYHIGSIGWQGYTSVTGVLTTNTWYHAVYVVSKSGSTYTGTLYLNGRVLGSSTSTYSPQTQTGPLRIGKRWDTAEYIDGDIPVVRIYNASLTADQVMQNFQNSRVRFLSATSIAPTASGKTSLTATAGTARDFSLFTASDGTGDKTLTLSGANSNFRIDTSTANTAIFKVLSSTTSTNATTSKTYYETLTAVDTNGIATAYYLTVVASPAIAITSTTDTFTTTFGRIGTITLNVTGGTGTGSSTFTRISSSNSSAISTTFTSGQAVVNLAGTLPAGTYYETFTATDSIGATAVKVITIFINAPPSLVSATGSNTVETTFTRATSLRLNISGGTGSRSFGLTYTSTTSRWRISIDTSTAASGFVTIKVDSYTATGTHAINVTVTDSVSATSSLTLNIVVNDFPILNNVKNDNSYMKPGLVLNLDAANTLSSTGSGNWKDLSGAGSSATFTNAPTYSTTNGGIFTFNGSSNYLTFPSITTATSPGVTNGAMPEYTAEAWVKFNNPSLASFSGTACLICEGYTGSTGSMNIALSLRNNGQIHSGYLPTTAQGWVETVTAVGTVTTGIWYHIASTVVKSGNNYINTIYVNGIAITSASSTLAPATSSRDYYIGRRWDSASQLLNGSIGVVRVYNRGLSQSEIQDNYNSLFSRYINTSARSSTFTTTQGATFAATAIPATLGTGNKTLTLTPVISGITSDTSTANSIRINTASNLAATDSQTARTYLETITATDVAGASVTHLVNVVVNPPIILSAATTSIATTSGIETSTVITASRGSSAKTFSRTGTAGSGITLTSVGDQATLRVLSTINPGTYFETITATDTASATTSIVFTIVVAPPPSLLGVSRLETSRGVLFRSPLYAISGGTGTLTMSVTNSPVNANITLTGTSLTGGFLQVGSGSETGTFTSTIRVTDARGAFSEIAVTVVVNAPVTLTGEFDIVKTYGDSVTKGYTTNSTGTAPFAFSATPVCAVVKTVSGSFTYERINGTDSCTWTAPSGVTAIDALLVGAGGGGGGDGGAGGGGGSINTLTSVSLPANRAVTVQVGAGGTGGAWGGPDATAGGTTSLASGSTTYTAPGGSAGGGCGAAGAAGGLTGSGGTAVAGGNGGTGASGSCGAGAGSVGSNGPSSSFTGSSVTYGGGGGGGPFPDSISLVGLKAGGAGGGGTGTQASGQGSYGLPQYFKTSTSTPPNATLKQTITSDICGALTGNISYSTDSEFPCSQKDNFQGWASGFFIAPVSGSITFYLSSDDSSQLVININGTDNNLSLSTCCTTVSATFNNFVAGQAYPINVYFTEVTGLASWKLEYAYAGLSQSIIPVSQFRSGSYGLATYFRKDNSTSALNKNTFTTGTCAQVIRNIDFANDAAFPCDGKDNFQGYATGYFIAPHTGSITFTMSSDDSSLLSINVNGTNRELPITIGSASATWDGFVKGQFYPISAFYTEITGSAAWRLEYEFTGQSRIAIPTTYLRSNIDFTAPTAGTNGLGGGGGAGSAGLFKINGAQGGSGTAILKYLTQSDTATETMITAFVNQESPSGLLTLNVPSFVTVGDYSQVIKVQDAANSAPYSATVRIRVNKATPRTTISLPGSVLTATYGTPVTLSVAASTPGNVAFKKAGTNLTGCSSVATSNGVATCTWTPSVVETASISALLSPSDSVNFNNSVETASAISVIVGRADTLTVTANDLSATYSVDGSNISNTTVPTRSISLTGLASIDSITAASYTFAGTINTGSSYSSSATAPKEAGTYSITPSAAVFTSPALATNYRAVTYAPGTLTINRAARGSWTLTYGSGTNVITYGASKTETPTVVHPGDGTKLYSTSSTTCSVNSSSGVITTLAVGSCDITLVLNQSANWLSDTKTVTVTINRGIRTASLTPTASTIRYGETTTVTSTILPVLDSATVTYSAGSSLGCAIDNVTGEVTGIRAGSSCGISVLYDRTDLYESATATASVTVNKALAPVVTTETITAVSYTGSVALVSPTYRVSGILARDILQIIPTADVSDIPAIPANTYTAATGYRYFATSPTSYDSTTAPTNGGTYQVFARGLSLLSGLDISNYETPTYVSADLVINPIAQAPLRILLSAQESVTVPYDITISGGSSTGALSVVVISGGTSTGCSVTGLRLTTSQAGTCVLQATKASDRNYLQVLSDTTTVVILNFVSSFSWDTVFSGTGISISSEIPIITGPETCLANCMPTVTDIRNLSGSSITTLTVGTPIKIIGTNFNTTTNVYFSGRIGGVRLSSVAADSFQVDDDNTLTVMPPTNFVPNAGENASNIGVRIVVLASGGSSFPNQQITIISL